MPQSCNLSFQATIQIRPNTRVANIDRSIKAQDRGLAIAGVKMSVTSSSTTPQSRLIPIAPAPDGKMAADGLQDEQSTMAYTCVTCARRKVKCDKIAPTCSTCRKARLECVYQEPAPRKRKRKPVDDIHERLEHYEKLLKQHGLLPGEEDSAKPSPEETEDPFIMSQQRWWPWGGQSGGKLVGGQGKSRYIDSNLWRNLGDEVHPSSDEEDDPDDEPSTTYIPNARADPLSASMLSPNSPSASLLELHPTYENAMKFWKIYVENVDPIIKALHVPTAVLVLQRVAAQPSTATKANEALVFAVYHFALISITDAECLEKFGEQRLKLLTRYHDALRQALVNVSFLRTTDLTVFQAFLLFLLSVRANYDPHTFWILTGVAVRIAQRLGLHRDGEELGLKPFDVEMRRRIFWQLLPLDGLAGQLCGTGICISPDSWNTKQPLNLEDTDFWPDMKSPPVARTGATDFMFCLARTEIARFVQKVNPLHSNKPPFENWAKFWEREDVEEKERQLDELESEMEMKYIRFCDPSNAIHNLAMAMLRAALNSGRLRIRLPRAKGDKHLPKEERKKVWAIANKIIDAHIAAHHNGLLDKFRWHLQAFFQYDPLIVILNEIRKNPLTHAEDDIWSKIEKVYNNHPTLSDQKRTLQMAVGRLTLKTWDAYQAALLQANYTVPPDPSYMMTLRSFIQRRASSSTNLNTPPKSDYNPFNPGDPSEDLPVPNFVVPEHATGDFDWTQMMDFNTETMDWMFWDQLVRDPVTSFPTS
jgi:hypothetical protein